MKRIILCFFAFFLLSLMVFSQQGDQKARLIVLADMGNEPDEEQQMMHLLMCSNEIDLEGLIAVTGKYLQPAMKNPYKQKVHPELLFHLIDGYSKVYPNLMLHSERYPDPGYLRSIVASGQAGYGIDGTGEGRSSGGSELIIRSLERDDPRPLYIVVNAGSNTLAQALKDFREKHSAAQLHRAISKLRVFENGAQDNCGAWICHEFPSIQWVRSNYQTYCYGGPAFEGAVDGTGKVSELGPCTWEPYEYSPLGQHFWALANIISGHGPFGMYYPLRIFGDGRIAFLEGGGTIPWLGLVNKGLSDMDHPWWGGWSGRYTREKLENDWSRHASVRKDEVKFAPFYTYGEAAASWKNPEDGTVYQGNFVPVWRWRQAFYNDFKCRMDWCILPYDQANHHPVAVVNGDASDRILVMNVTPGEEIDLDSDGSSDPDGDDLDIKWWYYREAGTYQGEVSLSGSGGRHTNVVIPADAGGREIHIILEVKDLSPVASLWDYRRVVMKVRS